MSRHSQHITTSTIDFDQAKSIRYVQSVSNPNYYMLEILQHDGNVVPLTTSSTVRVYECGSISVDHVQWIETEAAAEWMCGYVQLLIDAHGRVLYEDAQYRITLQFQPQSMVTDSFHHFSETDSWFVFISEPAWRVEKLTEHRQWLFWKYTKWTKLCSILKQSGIKDYASSLGIIL